jgi:hypothetical protein
MTATTTPPPMTNASGLNGAESAPTRYAEALAAFRAERYGEAKALLEACLAEQPEHVGSRFGLAACLIKLGDAVRAEVLLRELVRAVPDHDLSRLELARLLRNAGRQEDAAAEYAILTARNPRNRTLRAELEACLSQRAPLGTGDEAPWEGASSRSPQDEVGSQETMAKLLDGADELPEAGRLGGEELDRGRRSVLSHRRIWAAPVLLLVAWWLGALQDGAASLDGLSVALPGGTLIPLGRLVEPVRQLTEDATLALMIVAALLVVSAVLNSRLTRYVIRRYGVEVATGLLFRSRRLVWHYDITDVTYEQSPLLTLIGTGRIVIRSEKGALAEEQTKGLLGQPKKKDRALRLIGMGEVATMQRLQDELYRAVLRERRAMKKNFA